MTDTRVWKPLVPSQKKLISSLGNFLRGTDFERAFASLEDYAGCEVDEQIFSLRRVGSEGDQGGVTRPLPVEGRFTDSDGQPVFVWAFCSDSGQLAEIEFWKPSGTPIQRSPFEADVTVGAAVGRR